MKMTDLKLCGRTCLPARISEHYSASENSRGHHRRYCALYAQRLLDNLNPREHEILSCEQLRAAGHRRGIADGLKFRRARKCTISKA